jgi:phage terminase large subunit
MQAEYDVEAFFADPSEPHHIEQCRRAGLRIEPAVNDVMPGIDAVAAAIQAGETVSPICQGLVGELPGYTWARDRTGSAREVPNDFADDACDALRYAIVGLTAGLDDNPWASLVGQRVGGVA